MPQRTHSLGGFRVQGKTASSASSLLTDALALQSAGCFGIVLEAVPAPVAALVSEKLKIPTIGVGAGAGCAGQVLVQIDMLGNFQEGRFLPKFVKRYANVFEESKRALMRFGGLDGFPPLLIFLFLRLGTVG
jgi:3-methyl-2-oxobutanoate hydroxymethyltransferase